MQSINGFALHHAGLPYVQNIRIHPRHYKLRLFHNNKKERGGCASPETPLAGPAEWLWPLWMGVTLLQTQSSPVPNASCTQYALVIDGNRLYLTVEFASLYLNEGPRWYESKKKAVMLVGRADPKDRPRADGAQEGGWREESVEGPALPSSIPHSGSCS